MNYSKPLVIIVLSLMLGLPLLRPGLPVSDDWVNMALRATAFHQGFLDGQLPVRVLPHLYEGYGYPVTNFLYPVPFYLAEVLILAGMTPLMAVKLLAVAAFVVGNLGMLRFMQTLPKNNRWGVWFSLLWVFEPFRLIALYQRGALGEILLLGLVPWILFFLSRPLNSLRQIIGLGVLIGILPGLHNSLSLVALVTIVAYWVTRPVRMRTSLVQLVASLVVAAITSSWFVVPALFELSHTQAPSIEIANVSNHFTPLLVSLPLLLLGVGVVAVESRLRHRVFGVVTILLGLLLLKASTFLWQIFALDALLQFPFRLVPLVSLMLLVGVARLSPSRRSSFVKTASMVVLVGYMQISWPQWQPITQDYLDTNFHSSNTHDEFAPLKASRPSIPKSERDYWFENPDQRVLLTDGGFSSLFIQAAVPSDSLITFARYDFPGWRVSVDGETVPYRIDQDGLIQIVVPASTHSNGLRDIRLELTPTPIQHLSTMLSLLAFMSIALVLVPTTHIVSRVSIVTLGVGLLYFGHHLITNLETLRTRYDPLMMEQKYLASQWVDPRSQQPLGDSGLYAHAGW